MHFRIEERVFLSLKDTLIKDAILKGAKEYSIKIFVKLEEMEFMSKENMAFYESVYSGVESLKVRCSDPFYTDRFKYILINSVYEIDESINSSNIRDHLILTTIGFFSNPRYSFYHSLGNIMNDINTLVLSDDGSLGVYFKGGFFPDDLLKKHKLPTFASCVELKPSSRIVFEEAIGI